MTEQINPRARPGSVCPRCDCPQSTETKRREVLDFKGLTLDIDCLLGTTCNHCGYKWTSEPQEAYNLAALKAAYSAKRDQIRHEEGLLSSADIARALEHLGISSKADAAAVFGGGPNAFHKYVTGDVLQSVAMDRLIRLAAHYGPGAVAFLRRSRHAPLSLSGVNVDVVGDGMRWPTTSNASVGAAYTMVLT